ncbi:MAG: IS21 family transposase [Deltaproteobacteria bacterium]|nr:IS21 family transposase [Deltaproteobacteria bacterium]
MTISIEMEAEIVRLCRAEGWPVGTIATQLGVHHDVVERVLGLQPLRDDQRPPLLIEAYKGFIKETLDLYPKLCGTRVFDMIASRGYKGSMRTLSRHLLEVRPMPRREAYLRMDPLIGEQAQIDWAHVGTVDVPGGKRSLWLFVIVLSWSRAQWGEFVFDLTADSLLRSLVRAAEYFGGTCRQWLFDNPKTVVLERFGQATRFHSLLLDTAGKFNVQLRVCGVRKANQKGRVERAIRWWRDRFLAARTIRTIEQGNRELNEFLQTIVLDRPHPTIPSQTVRACFEKEKLAILRLPDTMPAITVPTPVAVDKTAFIRLDTNSYSVPPCFVGQTLTMSACDQTVRVLDSRGLMVAQHKRSWGRRQVIEDPAHRESLLTVKRGARESKGRDRLRVVTPQIDVLVDRWVEAGANIGSVISRTVKLLDTYGPDIFAAAINDVVERGIWDVGAIAQGCEQKRIATGLPVPVAIAFGEGVKDRHVKPHSLESYDDI